MSVKIGGPIFNNKGMPGIVIDRDQKTAELVVDRGQESFEKATRHGFLLGMDSKMRDDFNDVMDRIKSLKEPKEKVLALQTKIHELRTDEPTKEGLRLSRYLESELFHVMSTYRYEPRIYRVSEDRAHIE